MDKELQFTAKKITFQELDDYMLLGLADDARSPTNYLLLERAYEFEDQDRVNGMDTYHVEVNDQEWSLYGGVRKVVLAKSGLTVYFDSAGVAALDGLEELRIEFATTQRGAANDLYGQLQRIFDRDGVEIVRD